MNKESKMIPMGDNILVSLEYKQKEEKTKSGLVFLNEGTEQSLRTSIGTVINVGEGRYLNNGQLLKPSVKVGDKILYNKYAGVEVMNEDAMYLIIKETDILAKLI